MIDIENVPVEALERIADASWGWSSYKNKERINGVWISDVHTINACNHVYSGNVLIDGTDYGFIIESGDRVGTEIREWGLADDVGTYDPGPPPEPLRLVPRDDNLWCDRPAMFAVYAAWRKEKWFEDLERNYNYDRHFAPGGKTETYYRSKAEARGLKYGYLSDMHRAARAMLGMADKDPKGLFPVAYVLANIEPSKFMGPYVDGFAQ